MRVEFPDIFIVPVQLAAKSLCHSAGQLAQHAVKVMDTASVYLQNSSIAYPALIGMNLACFEVAILICRVVNFSFNLIEKYEDAQENQRRLRSLVLGAIFVSSIGVGNWAFHTGLRLPISRVSTIAVSVLSCMTYFICKACN